MSSSQSRGCLGKGDLGLTPPGSRKAGQGVPHSAARQQAGAAHAGGHKPPAPSTCLAEDRLILQKHQHRAADLHPPGQTPAGERAGDSPPGSLPGWGCPRPECTHPDPHPYPLGRKLLCQTVETPTLACTARSITNTSASAEPTACCWMPRACCGGMVRGHPCPGVTPAPGCHHHSPPMLLSTLCSPPPPASHPGTPNLTQTPLSHEPPWPAAHIAGGAEVALGVDGREDEAGGHCPPACQHPQQQEAGTLQQQPPQLGPAVGEAPAPRLCLRRDPATSWDSHSPTIPRDSTPRSLGHPWVGQASHAPCSQDVPPSGGQRGESSPPHLSLPEGLGDSHPMLVAHHVGPPLYGVCSELQEGCGAQGGGQSQGTPALIWHTPAPLSIRVSHQMHCRKLPTPAATQSRGRGAGWWDRTGV